jgi:hypothetical protein
MSVLLFYLIQLIPEHAPGHVKVGITDNLPERLAQIDTSSPRLIVVKTWECPRHLEQSAIKAITVNCRPVPHRTTGKVTEVFDTDNLGEMIARGDRYFAQINAFNNSTSRYNQPQQPSRSAATAPTLPSPLPPPSLPDILPPPSRPLLGPPLGLSNRPKYGTFDPATSQPGDIGRLRPRYQRNEKRDGLLNEPLKRR